jgi:ADP-L-glycero-D-manno-heptose 6-epimerase
MYLVTGGAGFIGSVLIKELNRAGVEDILIVDRLRCGDKWKNLRGLKFVDYCQADEFLNAGKLNLFKSFEAIFHIGACSSTTETDADYLMWNNFLYSKEIFTYATKKNIPLLYASSAATYGNGSKGYSDDHALVDGWKPLNPYGYSKQVFDQWVLAQGQRPKTWLGIKFFNVFGPNEYHKETMASMVYHGQRQIKLTGKLKLFKSYLPDYKDGEQIRDFIYVRDAATACLQLLKKAKSSKKNLSGIYNMGTGKGRSFNDLARAIFAAMGLPAKIEYFEMPETLKNQYQYYTQAEMKKFSKALPQFQFHSLEEGIKDYVLGFLQKDNPYY